MNNIGFLSATKLGTEESATANSGAANDTVITANTQRWAYITAPSTYDFYVLTGAEVSNGTVVDGSIDLQLRYVDAIPPVLNNTVLLAKALLTAQAGTSAVQRINIGSGFGNTFLGGSVIGVCITTASATARYNTATVSSRNNTKSISATSNAPIGEGSAWAATTEEPYARLYFKPVL